MSRLRTTRVRRSRLTPTEGSDCTGTRHGTYGTVRQNGCRCPDALQDRYRYEKRQTSGRLQPAMVDGIGVIRRLQAMNALGYGCTFLAGRLDSDRKYVLRLMSGDKSQVHRATAAAVAKLYRELVDKPAKWNPDYCSHMTKAEREARIALTVRGAENRGYLPPGRWGEGAIDNPQARPENDGRGSGGARPTAASVRELIRFGAPSEAVRRAYHDIPRADRPAVVAELTGRGKTAAEIAELLKVAERTITRQRAAARDGAEPATQQDTPAGRAPADDRADDAAAAVQAVEEHLAAQDDVDDDGWRDEQAADVHADDAADDDARDRVDA